MFLKSILVTVMSILMITQNVAVGDKDITKTYLSESYDIVQELYIEMSRVPMYMTDEELEIAIDALDKAKCKLDELETTDDTIDAELQLKKIIRDSEDLISKSLEGIHNPEDVDAMFQSKMFEKLEILQEDFIIYGALKDGYKFEKD